MSEWKPPVAVQDHMVRKVVYADNRVTRDVNVTWTEADYKEFVQGYRCVRCFAHVKEAFPVHCPTPFCDGYPEGFPMKDRQREVLEAEFDGEEWIGVSRSTYEAEQNALDKIWTPPKRS